MEDILLNDRYFVRGKLHAKAEGEVVIELNGDDVARSCRKRSGNGAAAGTDFEDGAAGKIAERGNNSLHGLRVVEEVLSEFGLRWHGLSRW